MVEQKKRKVGRPRIIETPEEMWNKAEVYFQDNPLTPSISELSLKLGFCDRHSFYDYNKQFPEFSHTISKIRATIVSILEKAAIDGDRKNVTGPIFMLKNFGYSDKIDINQEIKEDKTITIKLDPKVDAMLADLRGYNTIEGELVEDNLNKIEYDKSSDE